MVADIGLTAVILQRFWDVGIWIHKSSTFLNHLNGVLSSDDISYSLEKLQFPLGEHVQLNYKWLCILF